MDFIIDFTCLVRSLHVLVKDVQSNLDERWVSDPCTIMACCDFSLLIRSDL